MSKKIIAIALGVVVLAAAIFGVVALVNRGNEPENPQVGEPPVESTEPTVDLSKLDFDGWSSHLMQSERKMIDVKTEYEPAKEGDRGAILKENEDGTTSWVIPRYSGVFEDGTKVWEIEQKDPQVHKCYEDENGVIYAHSSETIPDEKFPNFYIFLIEYDLFTQGMQYMAEYYNSLHPEPDIPVLTNVILDEDSHKIVVKVDALLDSFVEGVVVQIMDENYKVIGEEQFDNLSGSYTLNLIDKGEFIAIGVCSYYMTEDMGRIQSGMSNVRVVPNKYYQDFIIGLYDEYEKQNEEHMAANPEENADSEFADINANEQH